MFDESRAIMCQRNGNNSIHTYNCVRQSETWVHDCYIDWSKPDEARKSLVERYFEDCVDDLKRCILDSRHNLGYSTIVDVTHIHEVWASQWSDFSWRCCSVDVTVRWGWRQLCHGGCSCFGVSDYYLRCQWRWTWASDGYVWGQDVLTSQHVCPEDLGWNANAFQSHWVWEASCKVSCYVIILISQANAREFDKKRWVNRKTLGPR